ncbi:MAG: amino acid adenylation domain-containing protein, partial [Rhodothermales bacterium]|nr:amino acid adenylation domain-containing protein [Rhodothermales bacterium]
QEGMLFHTLVEPGSGVYVEQYACTLRGPLRADVLRQAWERALQRHAVLRTAFLWDGLDEPLQVVRHGVALPWAEHDWRALSADEQRRRLDALLHEDRISGFEPAQAPLLRLALIRIGEETHRLIWSFHHLLLDGWSTALVLKEVLADYAARCQGQPFSPPAPRPFRDYIAWRQAQDLDDAEAFWRDALRGFDTPTPLTVDRPAPEGATEPYEQREMALSPDATAALTAFARRHRLTLNTLVQGAWAVLLSRYSGERDVVFGTTVAGRPAELTGVEAMVGPFISTLPVRATLTDGDRVVPWLRGLQDRLLAAQLHGHAPLVRIQRWSEVDEGRPLFESLVVFENYPLDEAAAAEEVGLHVEDVLYREQSNYPLALLVVPGPALRLIAVYDAARFDADTVSRLLGHAATLLSAMAERPEAEVADLPLLTPSERAEVLSAARGPRLPAPPDSVLSLVAAQVERAPDAKAVAFEDETLTYRQLWERSGRLAAHLRARGVGPDVRVGLCLRRSSELVVGVLGILRVGGAYVPLDPAYPAERLRLILEDAAAPLLVTRRRDAPATAAGATLIDLDADLDDAEPLDVPPPAAGDPAYVLYTSGTTGRPKGVRVTHGNLAHSTQARLAYYGDPVGAFLLLSSVAFDSSVAGLFWTLATGGTLVLPPERLEQDVPALAALIARRRVTHTLCLPSLYRVVLDLAPPERLASLRCVIAAGEALPPDLPAAHYGRLPDATLYNEYGPTEATVWATVHRVPRVASGPRVPIGRPIPGAQTYVLDPRGEPVPFGVPGEVCIGGGAVADGYLDRTDRTARAFVPDPFSEAPGARLYRTGDRARALPDGTLDFLGRMDAQVKVRGHRVELGEVEAALRQHPDLRDAAAVVHPPESNSGGPAHLVAYVVPAPDAAPSGTAVRAFLQARVPPFMVPSAVRMLDTLPRTP